MTALNKFVALCAGHDVAIRLSLFYIATFAIVGTYISFLPLWLASEGLSEGQIAMIYAMPVLLRPVFTTLLSFFADRSGRHVWLLKMLALGAFASVAVLPVGRGFAVIFVAFTLFALFWTTVIPLTDAVALMAARRGAADYGRMRLWGSISFIVVTLAGGASVDAFGATAALWLFIASAACAVLAAQFLPEAKAAGDAPVPLRTIRLADLAALVKLPVLWLFLLATSVAQATHSVYYLFGTIHWTREGISPTAIGLLWAIGVVSEIVLFAYGARVSRHLGPVQLIIVGGLAAVLRWTLTSLDPPLAVLLPVQLLHGLSFGASYLGGMQFMARAFPQHLAATGQGIYASFSAGVVMGSAYLAAGPLYRALDSGAYLAMAGLGVVSLLLALALMRRWDGETLL